MASADPQRLRLQVDCVKTRVMNQPVIDGRPTLYQSSADCFIKVRPAATSSLPLSPSLADAPADGRGQTVRAEGLRGLYKGSSRTGSASALTRSSRSSSTNGCVSGAACDPSDLSLLQHSPTNPCSHIYACSSSPPCTLHQCLRARCTQLACALVTNFTGSGPEH
jgi:hypothetical protein